jgi:hypothetical protein
MIYVILLIVVVVLVVAGVLLRRKTAKRGFGYVPDPNQLGNQALNPREIPVVAIATPEFETEEITHDEFTGDVSDDLLDPRNPNHADWVNEHPGMKSDTEWVQEHPEDDPT